MTNILQHIPSWKLIQELEARGVLSAMAKLLLPVKESAAAVEAPDPSQLRTNTPQAPPDKQSILHDLGARLNVLTDTRSEGEINGLPALDGDTGDPPPPSKYVVMGEERAVLLEASMDHLRERLGDPDCSAGERAEISRQMELRRSSVALSLGAAGAIAANLKSGAEAAFIQPSLPGVPGQGITHADIIKARRWAVTPLVRLSFAAMDTSAYFSLAKYVAADPALGSVQPPAVVVHSLSVEVTSEDRAVAARMLVVLAQFLSDQPCSSSAALRVYEHLGESIQLPRWTSFVQDPKSVAQGYLRETTVYFSDLDLPRGQSLYLTRFLNPVCSERAIPQSFFDAGQREGLQAAREAFQQDLEDQGVDPSLGVFRGTSRPPRVTGNYAVDQTLASCPEHEGE